MTTWQPLTARTAGTPPPAPVEDVTPRLHKALVGWLQHVLIGAAPGTTVRPRSQYDGEVGQLMLRLDIDDPPWQLPADQILDAVDATLRWHPWNDWSEPDPSHVEQILSASNFAWRVAEDGTKLESRVDPTVTLAYQTAVLTATPSAAQYLQIAWDSAYGRSPDPDKAYDNAVLAVEDLLGPLVMPNDNSRTLGRANGQLKATATKWLLNFGDDSGAPAASDALLAMSTLLWKGQSRHAGSTNTRSQTQAEAEAAVHLASTLVQWLSIGLLQKLL